MTKQEPIRESTQESTPKKKAGLPKPILILALTTVLSLASLLGEKIPGAAATVSVAQPASTIEQPRSVVLYFKVMNWLTRLVPEKDKRVEPNRPVSPAGDMAASKTARVRSPKVQLCSLAPISAHQL